MLKPWMTFFSSLLKNKWGQFFFALFPFFVLSNQFFFKTSWTNTFRIFLVGPCVFFTFTILCLPLILLTSKKLKMAVIPFGAWGLALWALFGHCIWIGAAFGIISYNKLGIFIVGLLLIASQILLLRWRVELTKDLANFNLKPLLKKLSIFSLIYLLFLIQHSFHPDLFWGEKPMDISFLSSFYKDSTIPLSDPWANNLVSRYYTFGYFLVSLFPKLFSLAPEYSYACSLSLLFSYFFLLAVEIFELWGHKKFAVLMAIFFCLAGNTKLWSTLLENGFQFSFEQFWKTTRIFQLEYFSEYPVWSFLFADLHPHVIDYPFLLLSIYLVFFIAKKLFIVKKYDNFILLSVLLSICLGLNFIISTWDFIFTFGLVILLGLLTFSLEKIVVLYLTPLLSLWFFLPEYISMRAGGGFRQGVNLLGINSIFELFNHFGLWWIFFSLSFIFLLRKRYFKKTIVRIPLVFFVGGNIFLVAIQFFYIMDPLNTIFKFSNSLFILFGIISFILVFSVLKIYKKMRPFLITIFSFSLLSVFPLYRTLTSRSETIIPRPNLSAFYHLKYTSPGEFNVVQFINEHFIGAPGIVELYGNSFQHEKNIISSWTGLKSYLGWRGHLEVRGVPISLIHEREREIDFIYQSPDALAVYELLKSKELPLVFIGHNEHRYYGPTVENKFRQFEEFFHRIYCSGNQCLYGVVGQFEEFLEKY